MTPDDVRDAEALLAKLEGITKSITRAYDAYKDFERGGRPVGDKFSLMVELDDQSSAYSYEIINNQNSMLFLAMAIEEGKLNRQDVLDELGGLGVELDEYEADVEHVPDLNQYVVDILKTLVKEDPKPEEKVVPAKAKK